MQEPGQWMVQPGQAAIDEESDDGQQPGAAPPLPRVPGLAGASPDKGSDTERGQGEGEGDQKKECEQRLMDADSGARWRT
jgi:hypothetical protein